MAVADGSSTHGRILGYDVARAVAIVGMVLVNFPAYLATLDGEAGQMLAWIANLHFGRAAALFVTLAGAGIALMARGAGLWRVRGTLFLRAAFLFVLGNLLILVWDIDILHFYAFYLAIAAVLFVGAARNALAVGAACVISATLALHVAWPDVASDLEAPLSWSTDGGASYWSVQGMLQNVFISGVHPVLPWIAFLMAGMWIAAHDLADRPTRRRLMALGASLALGAPLLSSMLEAVVLARLLPADVLTYLGVRQPPSPLFVIGAIGTALLAITLCQEAAARWPRALLLRALAHAGQMALTLYVAHALLGVVLPQQVLGVRAMPLAWTLVWALTFCLAAIVAAHLYRLKFKRGPLEWIMRTIAGASEARAGGDLVRRAAPPRGWWLPAAAAGSLVIANQFVAMPPVAACASPRLEAGFTAGRLTLPCPTQTFALTITQRADVVLETQTNHDLVLELYARGERIAYNDDGGVGSSPRLETTLDPGDYQVLVRPFDAAIGAFMLTRLDAPATLPRLGPGQVCTDKCESARDGECDDGGPGALYAICAFGSDCGDCGVRTRE